LATLAVSPNTRCSNDVRSRSLKPKSMGTPNKINVFTADGGVKIVIAELAGNPQEFLPFGYLRDYPVGMSS
jgi:hypothetical protein